MPLRLSWKTPKRRGRADDKEEKESRRKGEYKEEEEGEEKVNSGKKCLM